MMSVASISRVKQRAGCIRSSSTCKGDAGTQGSTLHVGSGAFVNARQMAFSGRGDEILRGGKMAG